MLGGVVVAAAGKREAAAHRAHVDDLPPALGAHLGQHELCEAHGSEDVGLKLTPGGVQRNGLDRTALAVSGVVDEHAHRTALLLDGVHRRAHRRVIGDVERERPAAGLCEIGDRLGATRGGVHLPARAREAQRGRAPDARGAPADQHRLGRLGHLGRSIPARSSRRRSPAQADAGRRAQ